MNLKEELGRENAGTGEGLQNKIRSTMLLLKRTRSYQKDQHMGQQTSDVDSQSYFRKANELKRSSFFSLPGLLVGSNPKCSELNSVRSPTSPLDFKVFSNLSNSFVRCPSNHRKAWDSSKVGLSIIDAIAHEAEEPKKILRASDSLLFRPQRRMAKPNSPHNMASFEATKSLPKGVGFFPCENFKPSNLQKCSSEVIFHTGEASFEPKSYGNSHPSSLDSARHVSHQSRFANHTRNLASWNFGLKNDKDHSGAEQFLVPASATADGIIGTNPHDIELSEEYTCVISHGPNPKVTRIFCDCVLECHSTELTMFDKNNKDDPELAHAVEGYKAPQVTSPHFLSLCYCCKKKLDGVDIYMYRGEKAFCSSNCRLQQILIDEEMEKKGSDMEERDS